MAASVVSISKIRNKEVQMTYIAHLRSNWDIHKIFMFFNQIFMSMR